MVKMTTKSAEFLRKHLPKVANAQEPNDILGPLYDLIMDDGFINHDTGYNEFGAEAQEVYDDIFFSNFDD